jgi:peptide/nickel transport system permease protein
MLSGAGLIAKDWNRETGVNYAPPSFIGADIEAGTPAAPEAQPAGPTPATEYKSSVVDPLADVLAEIRGEKGTGGAPGGVPAGADESKTVDPLADVMADIKANSAKPGAKGAEVVEARTATLPFGGDKWGRYVLKKTIKGSETSIFVGLAAAAVAVFIGTVFGALAGYYGKWVDDFFNWFYSIFSSIPYLLLILAVAAVLQQKGIHTIILILGLTGWTGVFRLIRGEYLKHKAREYVQAADASAPPRPPDVRPHLPQREPRRAGAAVDPHCRFYQGRGDPVVPGLRRAGRRRFVGLDAERSAERLILGKWWQLVAATVAMATLVTAFSLFTDALRDALDPKLKGRMGA